LGSYWTTQGINRRNNHEVNSCVECKAENSLLEQEYIEFIQDEVNLTTLAEEGQKSVQGIPKHYRDAMRSPKKLKWCEAMDREINSLRDYDVFEEIPYSDLPPNTKPLNSTWVFSEKELPNNEILEKARLCIRGDTQNEEFTLQDIFNSN
jgi:hypothetical protein